MLTDYEISLLLRAAYASLRPKDAAYGNDDEPLRAELATAITQRAVPQSHGGAI
jgi:hypothetical protein